MCYNSKRLTNINCKQIQPERSVYVLKRIFNVTGLCVPNMHYMADISRQLSEIRLLVDKGCYFTINRARQYGKTTTLAELAKTLSNDYLVVSLDFQVLGSDSFENENKFSLAFAYCFLDEFKPDKIQPQGNTALQELSHIVATNNNNLGLMQLFKYLQTICIALEKPVVLIVDEVDSAADSQVFIDFLSQLRYYYLKKNKNGISVFKSVILASVYNIKNLKRKIRPDEKHTTNSPWNIAADFNTDMAFNIKEITGMIKEYEIDYQIGMDVHEISKLIYDYTSGYPFLVSKLCKIIDECITGSVAFPDKKSAWTKEGLLEAIKILLGEPNTLFDSLLNKLEDYPELKQMLWDLLFKGKEIVYVLGINSIEMALMFGFVKKSNNNIVIANRIFEMLLYNLFLAAPDMQQNKIFSAALQDKNQFIQNGHLNMELVLEKFIKHFNELYGDKQQRFHEDDGRRYFLLYLKPIINGTGNYYIESQTRNMRRTDVIFDYNSEQFIIEMKIWHGNEYNTRGEYQLSDYLDYYHLDKGYMLSFNFNKKKESGIKKIVLGSKTIIEAVV